MQQPSVVHIATYVNGGAGTAAYRIHKALLDKGLTSVFLCTDKPDALKHEQVVPVSKPYASFFQRVVNKLKRILANIFHVKGFNNREYFAKQLAVIQPQLVCEVASLPFSAYDLVNHPAVKKADILHLHWVAGFVDYPRFFGKINKPVVWTFHDRNPFMGLYHYEADEQKNKYLSNSLNNEIVQVKKNALNKVTKQILYVAPAQWMLTEAKESKWFAQDKIFQVGYTLDEQVFRIKDKIALRAAMGIPASNTVFLFVSQTVSNYRKGFDLLTGALSELNPSQVTLLIIGEAPEKAINNFNCVYTGFINDDALLSDYYTISDAFILPSREDNLPNVMLESLLCGTPVICFDTGGMTSTIQNGLNGFKIKTVNSTALAMALREFISKKQQFDPVVIRNRALKIYSQPQIALQYVDLYKNLLYKE